MQKQKILKHWFGAWSLIVESGLHSRSKTDTGKMLINHGKKIKILWWWWLDEDVTILYSVCDLDLSEKTWAHCVRNTITYSEICETLEKLPGAADGSVQPFTGDIGSALRALAPREPLYSVDISSNFPAFLFSYSQFSGSVSSSDTSAFSTFSKLTLLWVKPLTFPQVMVHFLPSARRPQTLIQFIRFLHCALQFSTIAQYAYLHLQLSNNNKQLDQNTVPGINNTPVCGWYYPPLSHQPEAETMNKVSTSPQPPCCCSYIFM